MGNESPEQPWESACCLCSEVAVPSSLPQDNGAVPVFRAVQGSFSPAPWTTDLTEANLAAGFAHKETLCGTEICLVTDISSSNCLSGPSRGLILLWVDLNPEVERRRVGSSWAVGFAAVCSGDVWYCSLLHFCLQSARLLPSEGMQSSLRRAASSSMPCGALQCLWCHSSVRLFVALHSLSASPCSTEPSSARTLCFFQLLWCFLLRFWHCSALCSEASSRRV